MNNNMRNFIYGLILLGVVGCAATYVMKTPFHEQDFADFTQTGTSYISGQAFLTTQGGEVKYGAGRTVRLIPLTKYTVELDSVDGDSRMRPPPGVNLDQFVRKTIGDGSGNFAFSQVPAGDYFLECPIYWDAGGRTTGSTIRVHIRVGEGARVNYILTK